MDLEEFSISKAFCEGFDVPQIVGTTMVKNSLFLICLTATFPDRHMLALVDWFLIINCLFPFTLSLFIISLLNIGCSCLHNRETNNAFLVEPR